MRREPPESARPVIVMTALRDEGLSAQVEALGGNAVLLKKPFDLADLESIAARLLARRRRKPLGRTLHH